MTHRLRRSFHPSLALALALLVIALMLPLTAYVASHASQAPTDPAWVIWETATPIQRLALRDGTLWAGAYKGGLLRWDAQRGPQQTYTIQQGLTGADVLATVVDAQGATWVALLDGGVARITADGQVTAVTPTGIGSARPWDLAVNGDEVWLATLGGGVAHYRSGVWTSYTATSAGLPSDDVYAVATAADGTPWVGTIGYGVAALEGGAWVDYTLPVTLTHPLSSTLAVANQAITDIAIDRAGNKWFATDGSGVAVLDSTNTHWTVYTTRNSGLTSDFVQRVVIDPQGNAWFGTLDGGVAQLSPDRTTWSALDTSTTSLTEDDVLDLAVDGVGGLWLASYDAGLSYYGPLPATPPAFDLNPRGLPAVKPGALKGYALWLDPESYTWTLAWSGDGQDHAFHGDVLADGPITIGSALGTEAGDSATIESNRLVIDAHERDGEDLVTFTLDRAVTTLTVQLKIDGAYYPFNMRIGAENARPGMLPFSLAAPQPQAPVVTVDAPPTAQEGSPIFLSGQYTDADSFTGHTISWNLGDGATVGDTLAFSHTYADDGTFDATLTVTDPHNVAGTATQAITVKNVAPDVTLDASLYTSNAGQPVTFTGTYVDPGVDDTHTIAWDFGDGSLLQSSSVLTMTHTYQATGAYTATLRVSDDDGGVGEATLALFVDAHDPQPTVSAGGPYVVDEGGAVLLAATGSVETGEPISYTWDLDSDGVFETPGQRATFSATDIDGPSSRTIAVKGTTSAGHVATDQVTVTVRNADPTASLTNDGPVAEGSQVAIRFAEQFDPSSADIAAGLHYTIACEGGTLDDMTYASSGADASANCLFDQSGSHTVRARIFDRDGGVSEYTTTVQVENLHPTATLSNSGPVAEGDPVSIRFGDPRDPSAADAAAGFHYAFACDGAMLDSATYASSGADAVQTCTFDSSGSHTVRARIIDQDGGATEYTSVVTVTNVAPTATLSNDGPVAEGSPVTIQFSDPRDP